MTKFEKIFHPAALYCLVFLVAVALVSGCAKDQIQTDNENTAFLEKTGDRSANTLTVCHKTGNGQYQALNINPNALQAHLAHGDYLPDADGDGYTAAGACTGTMDDCDDNDPGVHPGATEICGNFIDDDCDGYTDSNDPDSDCLCNFSTAEVESILNALPYAFYYNSDENECFVTLFSDLVFLFSEDFSNSVLAGLFNDPGTGETYGMVIVQTPQNYCEYIVGQNLTQTEYEAVHAAILAAIAANPGTPNICDFFLRENSGINAKAGKGQDSLLEQMKIRLPERLSKLKQG